MKRGSLRKYILMVFACAICISGMGCGQFNSGKSSPKKDISILAKNSWYSNVDYLQSDVISKVSEDSGYNVQWSLIQPANYYDAVRKLLLTKNSDNLADIVQLPDLDMNMDYIEAEVFISLDNYLDLMPNFSRYLDENPGIRASLTTEDGHIYYVPQTVLTKNYQPCIMYNTEWLKRFQLEQPKTLDEFVNILRLFKENDMNQNGDFSDEIPMSVTKEFLPYMFGPAFGLDLVNGFYADENGTVHYAYYEEENYKAYLTFLNRLHEEGLLEKDYETLTRDDIAARCAKDETGVIFDYSWQMSTLYSAMYDEYNGTTPVFSGGVPLSGGYEGYYVGRNAISGFFGITVFCSEPQEAAKLLDYIMGEECQETYCWGIEGRSYTTGSDGKKRFTSQAADDAWLQKLGINPVCVPSHQSVEASDALLPEWHRRIDKELVKYVKSPFPFIYSTSDELALDKGYSNYISQYVVQQADSFITGKSDIESFDWYMQTLENMNIKEMIEIKQKQYDRYQTMMKNVN